MALVTVQRSPCRSASIGNCHYEPTDETDGSDGKDEGDEKATEKKNISECYFAVKGAALVLPHDECLHVYGKAIANGVSDIQQHLQAMFYLLHPNDILKMAVKLESIHPGRTRYLAVVSRNGKQQTEESCLLGIDCNSQTTIGLVLPVWADTRITLDGDGGFSVTSSGRHHIFKPVSVQAMWSALQTLHKASSRAREYNYFKCGGTHQWTEYYEKNITSDRSCLNEWHAMDDIESRRPPSPDTLRSQPTERDETERHIRTKLKELMMSVDLDEVTSKYIRTRLEEILDMNLKEYKSFIDQEMLTILGQMDAPTEIFQYLYLGSEWNASNLEELKVNRIGHILNVTREIDNFFPGMFDYQNVRVYDDESTEILHYWDKTYRYIRRAKDEGSKVLVHCKMGISRSASVVIAYVMKAYDWNLQQALDFVKTKRSCIKPNSGFLKQLEIYQGILDASKQRHNSLWRSKSETNLKSTDKPKKTKSEEKKDEMPTKSASMRHLKIPGTTSRPKSWSPNDAVADELFPPNSSLSNETLAKEENLKGNKQSVWQRKSLDPFVFVRDSETQNTTMEPSESEVSTSSSTKNPDSLKADAGIPRVSSIKDRINELESHASAETKTSKSEVKSPTSQSRSGLVLNLATQFESASKPSSPVDEGLTMVATAEEEIVEPIVAQMKPPAGNKHHAVLVKPSVWPSDDTLLKPLPDDPNQQLVETASPKAVDGTENCSKKSAVSDEAEACCKKSSESLENTASSTATRSSNTISPTGSTCDLHIKKIPDLASKSSHCVQDTSSKLQHTDCSIDDVLKTEEILSTLRSTNSILCPDAEEKSHSCVLKLQIDGKTPVINQCTSSPENCESLLSADISHINTEHLSAKSVASSLPQCDASACTTSYSHNVPSKSEHFYEKEDIPFTPGTVKRTKQQIEEKNLTRTTSFDSGFPVHPHSTPSSPPDSECVLGKPVQRSHSLRNERRPTSMFAGKWIPLPALASPLPRFLHGSREKLGPSHYANRKESTMVHSMSTPSVVEAVNQVICGTQEVLSSAIQSLPLDRLSCPPHPHPNHLSSSSSLDFGSVTSLSDMEVSNIVFGVKNPTVHSESPLPGIVRQQREILENKNPRHPASEKNAKVNNQLSNSLVSNHSSAKTKENSDFGIVKRLTKELEAKASTKIEKEKSGLGEDDFVATESPKDDKDRSQCLWSSPERECSQGGTIDWEGCHPAGSRPPTKSATENLPLSDSLQVAPPTPRRKGSLDHNCLRKTSHSPLTIKLSQMTHVSIAEPADISRNISSTRTSIRSNCLHRTTLGKDCQCQTDSTNGSQKTTSNRPPAANKVHHGILSNMPPPPPPLPSSSSSSYPPTRKVRKQQGSTHPLSKLTIRQRHVNPMYNTM